MKTAAILVAAGRGSRMGADRPKQYLEIGGKSVLRRTAEAFVGHPGVDLVQVVIGSNDQDEYRSALMGLESSKLLDPVFGGESRSGSVMAGLKSLKDHAPEKVLIHDAARPFCPDRVITDVIAALDQADGAFAAVPVVDALWHTEGVHAGEPVARDGLVRAQTPQGFDFEKIVAAFKTFDGDAADDVAIARAAGLSVVIIPSDEVNFKITTKDDLIRAERHLSGDANDNA